MALRVALRAFREIPDDMRAWSQWIRESSTDGVTGTVETANIADTSVTYAKVQSVNSGKVLGRLTAGVGTVEEVTIGTTLIDNNAVTYAKLQDVSATDRVLGRSSAGSGDAEEITCTAAGRNILDDADATAQRATLGSTVTGDALFIAASVTAARTTLGLATGTYTPTLTNTTNLAASTAFQCQWMQVADMVTVSGRVDIDPTLAGSCVLGISLPVASNIGAVEDLGGAAFCPAIAGQGAALLGDVANDRATMQWIAADITNQPMYFQFMYQVI